MVLAPIWELIFHAMQFSLKLHIPISANSFENDLKNTKAEIHKEEHRKNGK